MSSESTNMEFIETIQKLEKYCNEMSKVYNNVCDSGKKSYDAGLTMFRTFNNHYNSSFARIIKIQKLCQLFDDYDNLFNDEDTDNIMEELCSNLYDLNDLKIKEKVSYYIKSIDNDMSMDSSSDDQDSCIMSKDNLESNEKKKSFSSGKNSPSSVLPSTSAKMLAEEDISIQNVMANPSFQEKLDNLIAPEMECIRPIALDTSKIVEKVKEISNSIGVSLRIIGPVVGKLSIGAFNDLLNRVRPWECLKFRTQEVFQRLYCWVINKKAILFTLSISPKKVDYFINEKILLPKPSYFWLHAIGTLSDEVDEYIELPIDNEPTENTVLDSNDEFRPSVRVNKYIRSYDISTINNDIYERTGKTYEFKNKYIQLDNIKSMTNKELKFLGNLNTVEICKEIRKHLAETNLSQKYFAEHILGMSQGSVSDLLSKPKEWHGLTKRGRDPYIKMRAYLDIYESVKDELKVINEKEEQEQLAKLRMIHKKNNKTNDEELLQKELQKSKSCSNLNERESLNDISVRSTPNNFSINNEVDFHIEADKPQIIPTNTFSIGFRMRSLLKECKMSAAIFAKNFMKTNCQDFYRIIFYPKSWNLCSDTDKMIYQKIIAFLEDTKAVDNFKAHGIESLQSYFDSNSPKQEVIANYTNTNISLMSNEITNNSTYNATTVSKNKRLLSTSQDEVSQKRIKLNEIDSTNKNVAKNGFTIANILSQNDETTSKCTKEIKREVVNDEQPTNIVSCSNDINLNKLSIINKDQRSILYNLNFINTRSKISNMPSNNHIKLHKNNFRKSFSHVHDDKIIDNNDEINKNDGKKVTINIFKLEILHLAWTYNANPNPVFINYLSQMTILTVETIEAWYLEFNKINIKKNIVFSQKATNWHSVGMSCYLNFIGSLQANLFFSSLAPYIFEIDKNVDHKFFGYIISTYSIGSLIGNIFFGIFSQKYNNTKLSLFLCYLLKAIGNVIYVGLEVFDQNRRYIMILSRFSIGLGNANSFLLNSYVAAISSDEDRSCAFSYNSLIVSLGMAMGPFFQTIFSYFSYPGYSFIGLFNINLYTIPAYIAIFFDILTLIIISIFFNNPSKNNNLEQLLKIEKHRMIVTNDRKLLMPNIIDKMKTILTPNLNNKTTILILILTKCSQFLVQARNLQTNLFFSSLAPYLFEIDGNADHEFLGYVVSVYSIGSLIANLFFGVFSQKCNSIKIPLFMCYLLTTIGNVIYISLEIVNQNRRYIMILSRFLIGLGNANSFLLNSYVAAISSNEDRSRAFSFNSLIVSLGMAMGPFFQTIFSYFSYPGYSFIGLFNINLYTIPAYIAIILDIVTLMIIIFFFNDPAKIEKDEISVDNSQKSLTSNILHKIIYTLKPTIYNKMSIFLLILTKCSQLLVQTSMDV
uniref:CUT domain-containing protein n=1 Tax=Parastrongyloides trichosuri TaxID=131310 RepID=A0A0N4ZHD8_PARTI